MTKSERFNLGNALLNSWPDFASRSDSCWFQGFRNVICYGHTSHDDDNVFMPDEEPCYSNYKAGSEAAESLLKCKSEPQDNGQDRQTFQTYSGTHR